MPIHESLIPLALGYFTGDPTLGSLASGAYQTFITKKNQDEASTRSNVDAGFARFLVEQEFGINRNNDARQRAIIDRILYQTGGQRKLLEEARQALGPRTPVNQKKIDATFREIAAQNQADVLRVFDRVASGINAGNIAKGVGNSTVSDMAQEDLVRRFAPELQNARESAYGQAIKRASSLEELLSLSRGNTLAEITDTGNAVITPELQLLSTIPGYSAPSELAARNQLLSQDVAKSANRAAGVNFENFASEGFQWITDFFRGRKPASRFGGDSPRDVAYTPSAPSRGLTWPRDATRMAS